MHQSSFVPSLDGVSISEAGPETLVLPQEKSPEIGTLLIETTATSRRLVKLTLKSESNQLVLESVEPKQTIAMQDVTAIGSGVDDGVLPGHTVHLSDCLQPYRFALTYVFDGKSKRRCINFLAFHPEVTEAWSSVALTSSSLADGLLDNSLHHLSVGLQSNLNRETLLRCRVDDREDPSTMIARTFAAGNKVTTALARRRYRDDPPIHYWTDWHFVLDLNQAHWTTEHVRRLWSCVSRVLRIEDVMRPWEMQEQGFWMEYVRDNPHKIPTSPLDSDELLKAYAERGAGLDDEKRKRLPILRALEQQRHKKARALDRGFSLYGIVSGLQSIPGHIPATRRSSFDKHYTNIGARFWAILVGINKYEPGTRSLSGCVPDVRMMADYLTTILHVPESHILVLTSPRKHDIKGVYGGLPTRANIVNAFDSHFRDNVHVERGDNLFFHFSGHGSSYETEQEIDSSWLEGASFIEALCPMDRGCRLSSDGSTVFDISDRELNIIFSDICESKGPNLTVALDCCHSGGATRTAAADDPTLADTRSVSPLAGPKLEPVRGMLAIAESRHRPEGIPSPLSNSWTSDMSTHMLIAACQSHETAKEGRGPGGGLLGALTFALVSALSSPRGIDPALTYADLVQKVIQTPFTQTIVLAGTRENSRLWFQEGPIPAQEVAIRGPTQAAAVDAAEEEGEEDWVQVGAQDYTDLIRGIR